MKKNVIYVEKQPKHNTLSVIVIDPNTFPKTEEEHNWLDLLAEKTDLVLVFTGTKKINPLKFATLYRTCAWTIASENLGETLWTIFSYERYIFKSHISLIIGKDNKISRGDIKKTLENIDKLNASTTTMPVFKKRRLGNLECFCLYYDSRSWWKKLIKPEDDDRTLMYATHHSEVEDKSSMVYLKFPIIWKLLDSWDEDYVQTFKTLDPGILLASMIDYLEIENLDKTVEDVYETERKE